QNWPHPQIPP
uniref:Bradykinin-potentiating peptide 10c n=2 Tax=Viperidae TaxID=8689 RepID=BPPAC_AGKBI|nr:RecName: Full=Bradykinin-potentiating peptide-like; AltName: Full=Bothrops-like BPP [Bitis rhinoceros]